MSARTTTSAALRRRLAGSGGFTLIELLIVIIIIGILLTIAVPSYLGFKDRANKMAAQANVRSAIPSIEAYYADHNGYAVGTGTMGNATTTTLAKYDAGIKVSVLSATTSTYCIKSKSGAFAYYKAGPAAPITVAVCS